MASDLTRARRIHWPLVIALVLWALLGRACFARVELAPTPGSGPRQARS